jgi:hypothetical protein
MLFLIFLFSGGNLLKVLLSALPLLFHKIRMQ